MMRREWLADVAQDARLAMRQLKRRPGFAVLAIVTLAVGVGASTAIFSAADHVLLRPLPFADADRVVTLWEADGRTGERKREVSPGNFLDWRARATGFSAMGLAEPYGFDITGVGPPQPVQAWSVSEGFFESSGVRPLLGRAFTAEEYREHAGRVVLVSHRLWQERFGADAGVVGRTIQLDHAPATIVGVLPPGVEYPSPARDVWAPKVFRAGEAEDRGDGYMQAVARLAPGVTLESARREMDRIATALGAEHPRTNASSGVTLVALTDHVLGGVRPALLVLLGAVGLVLLIACANVASLLLARGVERERELGVRAALGAGRKRLVRQLATESIVLATLGGALGTLLAFAGVRAIAAWSPPDLPRLQGVAVDGRVLGFAALLTFGTALLFGLAPAVRLSRPNVRLALGSGARTFGTRATARLRGTFVVLEIALALVLLIGAGLLARSFVRLLANDVGFAVDGRAALQLFLYDRTPTAQQRYDRVRELEQRFRALPGADDVAIVSALPFHPSQIDTESSIEIEGRPHSPGQEVTAQTTVASPEYFRLMQIPLRAGRAFTEQDGPSGVDVAIISETLARRHFPGENPIGKRITIGVMGRPRVREIVGVVGDVRPTTLDSDPRAELYVPWLQSLTGSVTFVVTTRDAPAGIVPRLREAVWAVDAQQTIYHAGTMAELIRATLVERRFHLVLLGGLSAVALVLATVGVYGLISFATQQRRSEIGVRMALGARRADVAVMIVSDALRLAIPGIALGLTGALLLTRFMRGMLYHVTPADPATYAQLTILMLGVAALAAYLPARRAARTDPMRVLRQE